MMNTLQGKHIVITGASGGLGEKLAYEAARRGANMTLLARNASKLQSVKEAIETHFSVSVSIHALDVSNYDDVSAVFEKIFNQSTQVDVLINNAGYGIFDEAHVASFDDIKGMFDVNVLGLISCTQQVLQHMMDRRSGHIVNIASQAGKLATPKSSAYSASKHAVLGYTNSLRMEAARYGVFVTAVNPGPIATNFFSIADQSGTYMKNVEKLMLDPNKVATKVIDQLFTKRREINLPGWMNLGSILYQLAPKVVERLGRNAFFKK